MSSTLHHRPARTDVLQREETGESPAPSRRWALAGVGAAVSGIVAMAASFGLNAVYDEDLAGNAPGIAEAIGEKSANILVFHVFESIAAVLLAVFAVGLFQRLRTSLPSASAVPGVAAFGLLATSVVMVMATVGDTEFFFASMDTDIVVPEALVGYNHWVGTAPGCWILAGLTGLALFAAARAKAVPVWIGRVGLVLGGLTVLVGISPMQYMAGLTGQLMLLVLTIGFLAGDRAHR